MDYAMSPSLLLMMLIDDIGQTQASVATVLPWSPLSTQVRPLRGLFSVMYVSLFDGYPRWIVTERDVVRCELDV